MYPPVVFLSCTVCVFQTWRGTPGYTSTASQISTSTRRSQSTFPDNNSLSAPSEYIHAIYIYCGFFSFPPLLKLEKSNVYLKTGWCDFGCKEQKYMDYCCCCCFAFQQWVPTCMHSWWIYIAALPGGQTTDIMTWYPMLSYYTDALLSSPCPIQLKPSVRLGSDKYLVCLFVVVLHPSNI